MPNSSNLEEKNPAWICLPRSHVSCPSRRHAYGAELSPSWISSCTAYLLTSRDMCILFPFPSTIQG